jgi:hypothetical protein
MLWIDDLWRHPIYIYSLLVLPPPPLVYIPFNVGVFSAKKRFVSDAGMMCVGSGDLV